MAFTVNEIGTLTVVTGGGFVGDYATGWSASNYYHITDLDTAGSAQLHSFVIFYKGTQTDAGANGELAIPLFGDKDNTGGITLGIDGGYLAISDGTTITRGTTLINDDEWHPIIFAVGDTTIKGYADGDLEVNVTPNNLSTVIINAIGNSAGASAYPTALDGIQIYDRFLFPFMVDDFQNNITAGAAPSIDTFLSGRTDVLTFIDARNWSGSGNISDNILATDWTASSATKVTQNNIEAINIDGGVLSNTGTSTLGSTNTYVFLIKWRASNSGWRTGYRGSGDHQFIVEDRGTRIGIYSNQSGAFRSTGSSISPDTWQSLIITEQSSSGSYAGTSTYYINGTSIGTTDRVKTGNDFASIGYSGQGPGKIAFAGIFNTVLTAEEISELNTIMQYYITNGFPASGSSSLPFDFITDPMATYNRPITEALQFVEHGFQDTSVQSVKVLGNQEEAVRNVTALTENTFDVYKTQLEGGEEDMQAHKKRILKIFYQEQITKEKWS
jgi:hypothetical protein